ncbi:anthranilate synthase [Corynebacterium aquilae DSM 44791]|uniref:Anthranilate synthase component 1 n=1 Tax=Corynebacterium aquilae DSM 44791 TaxID=1431546 RepID=A0A1L7CIU5_9CORY|nr:anthranilate synthase [Corynebacterium aquilae DSM 44791]
MIQRRPVTYHDDASALFERLGGTTMDDSVLLESADIQSKVGLQSVAVLRGSARVTCVNRDVTVAPLSPSGEVLSARLAQQLPEYVRTADTATPRGATATPLTLHFPESTETDERKRLMDVSSILPLRLLQRDPGYSDEFLPFIAGGFAFDYLETFETLPEVKPGANGYPDYQFLVAEIVLRIDHQQHTAELIGVCLAGEQEAETLSRTMDELSRRITDLGPGGDEAIEDEVNGSAHQGQPGTLKAMASATDQQFRDTVVKLQGKITDGDIYQVVPARTFSIDCPDSFAAYQELKKANPSPYMFYVRGVDAQQCSYELFGASPESNLKYTAHNRQVELYPIAGTRPRGLHEDGSVHDELDIRAELELRTDAKEIAEHVMLVDLARNDLARVATPATRRVAELLHVDRYSRVMHLVSRVTARLDDSLDCLDAYRACMNMGTLTGAPKIRATELLRRAEGVRRGSYGGAVGYLEGNGDMDTCIVIRSAFVRNGVAAVQAGAGVVRDSQPQAEADETVHKAYAVLSAIAASQNCVVEVVR